MKSFREFINKGIIRRMSVNKSRARDLFEESERKLVSLRKIIDLIGLSEENANDIIEYCYDIIIGLIRSKLHLDGFKSLGEGAHEAEVSYLKELGFSETEVKFTDEIRYFRNKIKYYGRKINKEYALKVIPFMEKVRTFLKEMIINGLNS